MHEGEPTVERAQRLLIVDDDAAVADLLRSGFADRSYDILEARDGESGLERVETEKPDLILLDVTMPGLDGISVARKLKADARTRSIPIILLTSRRDVETKVEAFAAGADDYVTKPFQFAEIDARVRTMLDRRRRLQSLEQTVRNLSASNHELEQLLMIDEKTGLYNFREFQRRLRQEWQRAERYGDPLSLVFFDLDDFKRINDTHGHPAGDEVLRDFAALITGGARANDVVARYGGEEFAIILPHTDNEMAVRVADRIRAAVEGFVFLRDESPSRVTVSVGVATYPSTGEADSMESLLRAADTALYQAKDAGKNRVCNR